MAREIAPQPQYLTNLFNDRFRCGQAPGANHPASEIAFVRFHDMNPAAAQRGEILLRGGVLPHIHVHGWSHNYGSLGGEIQRGKEIFRNAVREFSEDIGGGRSNQKQINPLGHGDVLNRAFDVRRRARGAEHIRDNFLSSERCEGEWCDEFLRRAGHHHLHIQLFLLQAANQLRGLISRHASGYAKRNFHGSRGGRYFRRLPSLSSGSPLNSVASYSSSPLSNSSSAMRVVLRDFGLSTMGRPPIINCLARRATTTT